MRGLQAHSTGDMATITTTKKDAPVPEVKVSGQGLGSSVRVGANQCPSMERS